MRSNTDTRDGQPSSMIGAAHSRRKFLALSAAGGAAALAGCTRTGGGSIPGEVVENGWTAADMPDMRGRRALVTGGNGYPQDGRSGLGYQAALALARKGADVMIASRNQTRGAEAVRIIRDSVPGAVIRFERLDLANIASVRAFGAKMQAEGRPLDVLINNAGVMGRRTREVSVDGFERCFATNVLGPLMLTSALMPLLRQRPGARVAWVASLRGANGEIDFNDLQLERDYDYVNAYDRTKMAGLLLALEMQRRSTAAGWGVTSVCAHPGTARTNIVLDGPGPDSREGFRFRNIPWLFRDPAQRVDSILYAATDPNARPGGYYGPNGIGGILGSPGPTEIPEPAQNPQTAATLWATLERLGATSFA